MPDNMLFSRIKSKRKEQNLTQQEFANKVDVSLMTVVRWENGSRTPNTSVMPKIAHVLNTSVGYLMGLTGNPNPTDEDTQHLNAPDTKEKTCSATCTPAEISEGMLYFRYGNKEVSLPDNEFTRPLFIQIISKMLQNSLHEGIGNIIKQDNNIGDNLGVIHN